MVVHVRAHQGLSFVQLDREGLGPGFRDGRGLLRSKANHHLHHFDKNAEVDAGGALMCTAFDLWRNGGPEGRDIEVAERENQLQHVCVRFNYCSHHVREDC